MKEIETNNLIFTDDDNQRMLMSEMFNFAFDKNSGVAVCWGKTADDTPEYDPVTPEEIVLKVADFSLEKYLNMFNFLANIKIKKSNTEFENIKTPLESLVLNNLACLSTIANVVLILDDLTSFDMNDMLKFSKYVKSFKLPFVIQINTNNKLSYDEVAKLKLLSTSVQIKTDDNFNASNFIDNITEMNNNNILVSSKIFVNKNSVVEIEKLVDKLDKTASVKLFFNEPYISTNKFKSIQNLFIENGFVNIKLATCSYDRFNKNNNNVYLTPVDCEAGRYSIYVESNTIYPCEHLKVSGIKLDECNGIHDFWYNYKIKNIREKIIDNNFCK